MVIAWVNVVHVLRRYHVIHAQGHGKRSVQCIKCMCIKYILLTFFTPSPQSPTYATIDALQDFTAPLEEGLRVAFHMEGETTNWDNHSAGHILGIEIGLNTKTVYVVVNAGKQTGRIVALDANSGQHIEYWLPGHDARIHGKLTQCTLKVSKKKQIVFIKRLCITNYFIIK